MIRLFHGRIDMYAPSGIFINPDYFSFYIDRRKNEREGVQVPPKVTMATEDEAVRRGWHIKASGTMAICKRLETPEVAYHREQQRRLDALTGAAVKAFEGADKAEMSSQWLRVVIDKYHHPDKYKPVTDRQGKPTLHELVCEYLSRKTYSYHNAKLVETMERAVNRYEGFIRATDRERRDFTFDFDTLTKEDIEAFIDYYRNESALKREYPTIFKALVTGEPRRGKGEVAERGSNTIAAMQRRLKTFFGWLVATGKTTNKSQPFEDLDMVAEQYGEPFYLSAKERNAVACQDFSHNRRLGKWRDIFIFQCLTGCRVGDLSRLTQSNIVDGYLVYTPHKTQGKGKEQRQARVPLHQTAAALIEKYRGEDGKGRLFPFSTQYEYNKAIREILSECGVCRIIAWRNPKTGESEQRPISEVATSHMARRTFVGNAYLLTPDPNIIARMSGHVEGSSAFRRYRKVEDTQLQDIISKL